MRTVEKPVAEGHEIAQGKGTTRREALAAEARDSTGKEKIGLDVQGMWVRE